MLVCVVTHSLTNLCSLKLLFLRLVLATQGLGTMLPNIADLLPDIDSDIQSGVLQSIVEVSIQSFYLRLFVILFKPFDYYDVSFLICTVCRMWLTRLITVWMLAWVSCRH